MPGLNLLMYIERVPKDSTSLVNAVSIPLMIEAISITVTNPLITPMMVRNERILLARKVARANQRFSRISERNIFISDSCSQNRLKIEKCKLRISNRGQPLFKFAVSILIFHFAIKPQSEALQSDPNAPLSMPVQFRK